MNGPALRLALRFALYEVYSFERMVEENGGSVKAR